MEERQFTETFLHPQLIKPVNPGFNATITRIKFQQLSPKLTFTVVSTGGNSFEITYYATSTSGTAKNTWTAVNTTTSSSAPGNFVSPTIGTSVTLGVSAVKFTVDFTLASNANDQLQFKLTESGVGTGTSGYDEFNISAVLEPTNVALGIFGLGFISVAAGRKYLRKTERKLAIA